MCKHGQYKLEKIETDNRLLSESNQQTSVIWKKEWKNRKWHKKSCISFKAYVLSIFKSYLMYSEGYENRNQLDKV